MLENKLSEEEKRIRNIVKELDADFKHAYAHDEYVVEKNKASLDDYQEGFKNMLEASWIVIEGFPEKRKEDIFMTLKKYDNMYLSESEKKNDEAYNHLLDHIRKKVDEHPKITHQKGISAAKTTLQKLLQTPEYRLKEIVSAARSYWKNPRQIDEEKEAEAKKREEERKTSLNKFKKIS